MCVVAICYAEHFADRLLSEAGEVIDLIDSDEEFFLYVAFDSELLILMQATQSNPPGALYRSKATKDSNEDPFNTTTTTPKRSGSKSVGENADADTETESESNEDEETQPR